MLGRIDEKGKKVRARDTYRRPVTKRETKKSEIMMDMMGYEMGREEMLQPELVQLVNQGGLLR